MPELNKSKCIRENTENLRPKILNSRVGNNTAKWNRQMMIENDF